MPPLILHLPVIHQGYLNLLKQRKNSPTFILSSSLIKKLSSFEPDIAALKPLEIKKLLQNLGFNQIKILTPNKTKQLKPKKLLLVQDDISQAFHQKYFPKVKVQWLNIFLRWDQTKVFTTVSEKFPLSKNKFDQKIIQQAYQEAQKSSDWWRQVGAVLVKEKKIIISAHNQDLPYDYSSYQYGNPRDFIKHGEKPEISNTIHAEQKIITLATQKGISLKNTSLYVTHFPCPICAKLIAFSGIKKLFFSKGSANLHGLQILKAAKIKITLVSSN
jgi:dCMP deaminase